MPDTSEVARMLRGMATHEAAQYMPTPRQLEVIDASLHSDGGWVWCLLEDSRVRCLVPANLDLSAAVGTEVQYVLWALPFTGREGSADYIAIGFAWNGVTSTREPDQAATSSRYVSTSGAATPESGATVFANSDGQLLAVSQNGTSQVINDDGVSLMNYLGG